MFCGKTVVVLLHVNTNSLCVSNQGMKVFHFFLDTLEIISCII